MDSIRRRVALGLRSTTSGAESESACRQAFEDLGVGPCRALVHEFQQVLWNEIATQRLRSGGRRAIQGDVVYNGSGLSLAVDSKTFQLHDVLIPVPGSDSLDRPSRVTGIVESTLRRHGLTTSDSPSHSIFSGGNNALGCTFIGEFRSICVVPAIACGDAAERTVSLRFSLPPGVSPWMAIRELCKFDEIRAPKIFKLDVPEGMRQETPQSVRQKAIQLYSAQRWRHTHKAPALDSAKLLQSIFHSGGMRKSLIPSPRGHDDVH
jgi:tRNA(Glu) U13 pseudouridine synthase TruD